ncbi:MAG: hypothetical protein CME70_07690 [Halobacteriovorax sp.]|nr:hypothetical protein [Halobacteriovorax sp.]|tara:strand:- start:295486 stop:297387 length:1902 start_codon:yes stop_codon:yes gene_type:complete
MATSIKKFIKVIMLFLLVGVLASTVFIVQTIYDAPLDIFDKVVSTSVGESENDSRIYLENGSGTDLRMLKSYHLFSRAAISFDQWVTKESKNYTETRNNKIIINNKIELDLPLRNECKLVYCFQKKIKFENIPAIFWKGLIGIEDERFLLHKGIDFKSLLRALIHDIRVMRLEQGGSTLTQQIVKNLFYTNEKKFSRKLKEMIVAVYLESIYEKEKILEAYFNEVIWGGKQGIKIKGLYAASLFYFSKKPEFVTPYEAAILIALLKGPNYYNPLTREERLRSRADLVFKKLVTMNLFPSENGERWTDDKWKGWIENLKKLQREKPYRNNWWLSNNLEKAELSVYERYILHSKIKAILFSAKERLGGIDIAAKAYFGDIKNQESRYFYYSKYERNWEQARSQEKHTLGSTIKPLIYSLLVDLGTTMDKEVETGELEVKLKSGTWKPREAHKIPEETVSLNKALKLSYNRPIIREVISQGYEKVELELEKIFPELKKPLSEYPAQLLGTVEISLEKLFSVYKSFVMKECERVDGGIVEILSDPRETTIRKLVGKDFGGLKFFGKTGTSNNGFDNWFVFYEGSRLGVIWVGLEGRRTGGDLKLYGGTTSFQIFKDLYLNSGQRFGEFSCGQSALTN